jgi:predicted transcriptional regulator
MKITSISLPAELTDRIDQVARDSERSRSFVVRKLLESALTGQERLDALQALAATGLEDYANTPRERAPNATAVIAESCSDGRARLDALQKIAAANRKGTR